MRDEVPSTMAVRVVGAEVPRESLAERREAPGAVLNGVNAGCKGTQAIGTEGRKCDSADNGVQRSAKWKNREGAENPAAHCVLEESGR